MNICVNIIFVRIAHMRGERVFKGKDQGVN